MMKNMLMAMEGPNLAARTKSRVLIYLFSKIIGICTVENLVRNHQYVCHGAQGVNCIRNNIISVSIIEHPDNFDCMSFFATYLANTEYNITIVRSGYIPPLYADNHEIVFVSMLYNAKAANAYMSTISRTIIGNSEKVQVYSIFCRVRGLTIISLETFSNNRTRRVHA